MRLALICTFSSICAVEMTNTRLAMNLEARGPRSIYEQDYLGFEAYPGICFGSWFRLFQDFKKGSKMTFLI